MNSYLRRLLQGPSELSEAFNDTTRIEFDPTIPKVATVVLPGRRPCWAVCALADDGGHPIEPVEGHLLVLVSGFHSGGPRTLSPEIEIMARTYGAKCVIIYVVYEEPPVVPFPGSVPLSAMVSAQALAVYESSVENHRNREFLDSVNMHDPTGNLCGILTLSRIIKTATVDPCCPEKGAQTGFSRIDKTRSVHPCMLSRRDISAILRRGLAVRRVD